MLVKELLEGKIEKKDAQSLRLDYNRWKKLINISTKILRDRASTDKTGLSDRDKKIMASYKMAPSVARSTLQLRTTPLSAWSTADVNFMYRQLHYVENAIKRYTDKKVDKNKPTETLKNLWAWGHIPGGLTPQKFAK